MRIRPILNRDEFWCVTKGRMRCLRPETLELRRSLASIHLRRTDAPFSATAARMRALNASSSISSPS